jgi:anti-sigma regulatory factor (Ser/Thr protein kinase)
LSERAFVVRSWPGGLDDVRAALDDEARAGRLDAELTETLALALEEMVANVFEHGFDDPSSASIEVVLRRRADRFTLELRDRGRPFDPLSLPAPDLDSDLDDRPVGGLGVHLARTLMDEVVYARDGDVNLVTMVKKLPRHGGKARQEDANGTG